MIWAEERHYQIAIVASADAETAWKGLLEKRPPAGSSDD